MKELPPYRVFWMPGCSSCLRTKEFLIEHGIVFESINVKEVPEALTELAELGFRSVPVMARGREGTYCQDLRDVAAFVGVAISEPALTPAQYVDKCQRVIDAACRYARQLSSGQLKGSFPGRDRPYSDLVYHIFMVINAFLESAQGGRLDYEWFERLTPEGVETGEQLAALGRQVSTQLAAWWDAAGGVLPDRLDTYYGQRRSLNVLERTTWHAAHHCRQLEALVKQFGFVPDGPLGDAELAGLPLPREVYDNEVSMS
ncbi:MAG: glutaredoxin domain-containing protein [Pseudomonadota bacterium]